MYLRNKFDLTILVLRFDWTISEINLQDDEQVGSLLVYGTETDEAYETIRNMVKNYHSDWPYCSLEVVNYLNKLPEHYKTFERARIKE